MENKFVTYEIALKLKELGYNEPCLAIYTHNNEHYTAGTFFLHTPHPYTIEELTPTIQDIRESTVYIIAPLWQDVIDWLRKRHNMWIIISKKNDHFENEIDFRIIPNRGDSIYNDEFKSFRKAREKAILKALSLLNKHN